MEDLQQLVRRYFDEKIDFVAFRAEMVARFLSFREIEPATQKAIEDVELACAEFSESLIDESALRRALRLAVSGELAPSPVASIYVLTPGSLAFAGTSPRPEDGFRVVVPLSVQAQCGFDSTGSVRSASSVAPKVDLTFDAQPI